MQAKFCFLEAAWFDSTGIYLRSPQGHWEVDVQEQSITLTFGMLPGLSLKDFSRVVKRKGVKLYPVGSKGFGNIFTGVQLPPKEDLVH